VLLWVVGGRGFHDNRDLESQEILSSLRTLVMRPNELWTCPHDGAARAQAPGCQLNSCEEEEEGTGVASDVVKVEGEDPDTQGYLRGDRVRLGCRRSWIVGAFPLACSR